MDFFLPVTDIDTFSLWFWLAALSLLSIFAGVRAVRVARRKGYSGRELFWAYCPLLNIIALLFFRTMPDRVLHARLKSLTAKTAHPDSVRERFPDPDSLSAGTSEE